MVGINTIPYTSVSLSVSVHSTTYFVPFHSHIHIAEPIKRRIVLPNSDIILSAANDTDNLSNFLLHTSPTHNTPIKPVTAAAIDAIYMFLVIHAANENTAITAIVLNVMDIPDISILSFRWNSPSNTSAMPSNIFKMHNVIISPKPAPSALPFAAYTAPTPAPHNNIARLLNTLKPTYSSGLYCPLTSVTLNGRISKYPIVRSICPVVKAI